MSEKTPVFLKTEFFPNVVTGNLLYKFHEKGNNKGDIDGVLKNDTLVADYKFSSEGQPSVRQVAFLIKDSPATEGYGPMEERNGKIVFKNINDIDYGKGFVLKKVSCPLE